MKAFRIFACLILAVLLVCAWILRADRSRFSIPSTKPEPVAASTSLPPAAPAPPLDPKPPDFPSRSDNRESTPLKVVAADGPEASLTSLKPGIIDRFIASRGRSAGSLLAAWTVSAHPAWLREAAARYPNDPAVQRAVLASKLFPNERAEWLKRFRETAPDNPLAEYFAASDAYASGDLNAFLAALREATRKSAFNDYLLTAVPDREALYLLNGDDSAIALAKAFGGLSFDYLPSIHDTMKNLLAEQKVATARGDSAQAINAAALAVDLGRALTDAGSHPLLIREFVGLMAEQSSLEALLAVPNAAQSLGFDPAERIAQIKQRRGEMKTLTTDASLRNALSPENIVEFIALLKTGSESQALQWLVDRQNGR